MPYVLYNPSVQEVIGPGVYRVPVPRNTAWGLSQDDVVQDGGSA